MAQFQFADVPGAFNRGLQFRQQQQLNPMEIALANQSVERGAQQNQFQRSQQRALDQQIDQRSDEQKNKSLFNTALKVSTASDEDIPLILKSQIAEVKRLGGNPAESERALQMALSGDFDGVRKGANNLIEVGVRQGDINPEQATTKGGFSLGAGQTRFDSEGNVIAAVGPSEQQQQAISIRAQEADLRAAELEDKKLERKIRLETNQLKKDELQSKLDESKKVTAQKKRDANFNAQSSIDAVANSVETIDSLLKGDGLESAAGFQANFPTIAGTPASDFEATLETLQSQAFLSQVEKMKGLGALSENEGKKLGAALGTLSINQSDKALRAELKRVKGILNKAKNSMQEKFGLSAAKTGELNADELAELEQLRAELGQ